MRDSCIRGICDRSTSISEYLCVYGLTVETVNCFDPGSACEIDI
nr:MAG TPA: hypothetical protein [Caudoviricetes sp.]